MLSQETPSKRASPLLTSLDFPVSRTDTPTFNITSKQPVSGTTYKVCGTSTLPCVGEKVMFKSAYIGVGQTKVQTCWFDVDPYLYGRLGHAFLDGNQFAPLAAASSHIGSRSPQAAQRAG